MRTSRAMSLSSLPVFGARDADKPPDLTDFLDADPRPTFLVPIGPGSSMQFKLSLWNQAFLGADVRTDILDETPAAMQFRSWCQAVVHWRQVYEFAGRTWTAFKIQHRWKCIQESKAIGGCTHDLHAADPHTDLTEGELSMLEDHVHADARLASLYKMMEMSDVGTFEYNPQGTLLRANVTVVTPIPHFSADHLPQDSWYRLSLHPKGDLPSDFSFMDLVYPPDGPMVLAHWNKLVQGIPVTFEMRWKGKNYRDAETGDGIEDAQWVLSACVPIHDASGNVVSIAGNTIDINAQKRVQEEALQRAEALERARESERKFKSFALLAPIAIYISDSCGMITYCNNRFFELTGHPPVTDFRDIDCSTLVYQEDQPILEDQWKTLLQDKHHTKAHFRLQNTWDLGDGTLRQAWAESQAFPELDDEGNVSSVFGTMTDISRFKWAEEIQRTRMEEALEAKRKHENFIDMTSHEMRNPLSAVIQCADSSIDTLKTVLSLKSKLVFPEAKLSKHIDKEIKLCLDSMNTIISCSIHQKRVIDDVLTLSKMDSNLLAITPVRVEPVVIVADAVHMFQLECVKDGIRMIFSEDPSLRSIGAQHVMLDPSRVLQILMNFITNAIKFTRDCPIRQIEVKLGACSSRPSQGFLGIPYAKVATDASNLLNGEEWGNGHVVYIWISCRDTGCGMTVEEQSNLFTRFSQATPRTHIRYGGSGLGLFISKKLAELQAGAIGVRSEPAVGSTFAFFVAARLAPPPTPLKDSEPGEFPMLGRRASLGSNGGSPLKPPPKYTVLIVEDNLVNVGNSTPKGRRRWTGLIAHRTYVL